MPRVSASIQPAALIRCTVPRPTPHAAATLRMLRPSASAARIACSVLPSVRGRPRCLPSARALAMPARMRSTMIARSNSANTPSIWNRPAASPRKPSPRHGRVPTGFSYTRRADPHRGRVDDVATIRDRLVAIVAERGAVTFDDLCRERPEWFTGEVAVAHQSAVLCYGAARAFARTIGGELAPGGGLEASCGYLADGRWRQLPITKERQRGRRSSHW